VELLKVDEAAGRLRLSPRTVYRMLERGALPGRRVGGAWRVPLSALPAAAEPRVEGLPGPLRALIDRQVDLLLRRVLEVGFAGYFGEADLAADLASRLRGALSAEDGEVFVGLSVAGGAARAAPGVSVLPPQATWSDRRGMAALYSAEFAYFSYRTSAYRMRNRWFRQLLEETASRFDRLAERRRDSLLGGGAFIWVDAFDWLERAAPAEREQVVAERAKWFRDRFARPGSEIRAEYLPLRHPEFAVSLPNPVGDGDGAPSLFGAARPFIRRVPAADEDWDEAVARSIAADYARAGERP
jgi:excisionase family DNA binding protein